MLGLVPCSSIYSEPEANAGIAGGAGYGLMKEAWSQLWQDSFGPIGASGCAFLLLFFYLPTNALQITDMVETRSTDLGDMTPESEILVENDTKILRRFRRFCIHERQSLVFSTLLLVANEKEFSFSRI